ncbi:MAG: porphobilinogen synthase [Kiritimatiellia bacterium]|jgi:porphobilinogen synthase
MSAYPDVRLRRLRLTVARRRLFDEPMPGPEKFIWPVFVRSGRNVKEPIDAMPGQFRYSADALLRDLERPARAGLGGVLVFGLTENRRKDSIGAEAWRAAAPAQQAVRAIKKAYPDLVVFTDVCLCAYTRHGHCGPIGEDGQVDNDAACACLAKVAVSHAAAGADAVAPSAMMDGQVGVIRKALAKAGFADTLLMSYSTKFASAMYGPFREAEQSAPQKGDRRGYQASYRGLAQALRESELDEAEGADMLMVKPALFYLDVIARLRQATRLPIAAYNVSGEYAMLQAAADRGMGDLKAMVRESIFAIRRAGADLIISYWANRYDEFWGDNV